jgi:hypothetical protein
MRSLPDIANANIYVWRRRRLRQPDEDTERSEPHSIAQDERPDVTGEAL